MFVIFHRYAVSVAIVVLGLSGCSSSQKSAKGTSTAGTDSLSSSSKKLEQDFAQTEADFGQLEAHVHKN